MKQIKTRLHNRITDQKYVLLGWNRRTRTSTCELNDVKIGEYLIIIFMQHMVFDFPGVE